MSAPIEKARPAKINPTAAPAAAERRAPAAFAIDAGADRDRKAIRDEPDFTGSEAVAPPAEAPLPARRSWLSILFWAALGILFSLYIVEAVWDLVLRLGHKNPMLGQFALGLAALAILVLLLLLGRELISILRMRRIQHLRAQVEKARAVDDAKGASRVVSLLLAFYAGDPTTAAARGRIRTAEPDILDASTRLDLAERELLSPKDDEARRIIAGAAQSVSMVTALSPRALVDMVFVLAQSIVMIRKLSALYGGNTGGLGLWRLGLRILTHLAVTGGVAMADSVIGQVLGAGLASRLSAKLGEGVLNGILTARVGIAALAFCRPMEFRACQPIILSEVASKIVIRDKVAENPAV